MTVGELVMAVNDGVKEGLERSLIRLSEDIYMVKEVVPLTNIETIRLIASGILLVAVCCMTIYYFKKGH